MQFRDPRRVYFTLAAVSSFCGVLTFSPLYRIQVAHLSAFQLVLVGTALEGAVLLFEIPTGVVADVVSRRLSIIIGVAIAGSSALLEGFVPSFFAILVSQLVAGIGYTFGSGATTAWLADEIGDDAIGPVLLRASQVRRASALVGIGAAVVLGGIDLALSILVGGGLGLSLAAWLVFAMRESNFTPASSEERGHWSTYMAVTRQGIRAVTRDRVLVGLSLVFLVGGAASESYDRLVELHLVSGVGLPGPLTAIQWLGLLNALALAVGIAVVTPVRRRVNTTDANALRRVLVLIVSLQVLATIAFGLSTSIWVAIAAMLAVRVTRGLGGPLYSAWVVPLVPGEVRATALSALGQANAVGQVCGGPGFGLVASAISVRAALLSGAAVLAPVPVLLATLKRSARAAPVNTLDRA